MPNPTDIFGNLGWLNKWVKNLLGRVRAIETGGGAGNGWKTSGTTILDGNVAISATNKNIAFIGGEEDIDTFSIQANNVLIGSSGGLNGISLGGLDSSSDTTNNKPLGIDLLGKIYRMNDWVGRPYKVYTALLTQSGGDDPQNISSGTLVKGVTYRVIGTGGGNEDFSNVGLPVFYDGAYFVATQNAEPINWDGAVLEYNTGAPVVTVLENTIGNISIGYIQTGLYNIYADTSIFSINKTFVTSNLGYNLTPHISTMTTYRASDEVVQILTAESGMATDGLLTRAYIEIRVYN
jgi:hypothetical protein